MRSIIEQDRIEYATQVILDLGYDVKTIKGKCIEFDFKGSNIKFFPYTGWATGKTIKDCRGLRNLVNQIKK